MAARYKMHGAIHDTLNEIARVRADRGDVQAFRFMQAQAKRVVVRRAELRMQRAKPEGPPVPAEKRVRQ
jgi:hypothetical protein